MDGRNQGLFWKGLILSSIQKLNHYLCCSLYPLLCYSSIYHTILVYIREMNVDVAIEKG